MNVTEELETEVLDEDQLVDVKQIGRAKYAKVKDGREVILLPGAIDQSIYDRPPVPGVLVITTFRRDRGADGRMTPTHGMVAARVVEPGTIERAERAVNRKTQPTPRPVDGLAAFRAGVPRTIVSFRDDDSPTWSILSKQPAALVTRGRTDLRDVGELVAVLRMHGTNLTTSSDGALLVESTSLWPQDAELLANPDARRLLAAWVAGKPLTCAWPHAKPVDAVTVAVGGAPICAAHLAGES